MTPEERYTYDQILLGLYATIPNLRPAAVSDALEISSIDASKITFDLWQRGLISFEDLPPEITPT